MMLNSLEERLGVRKLLQVFSRCRSWGCACGARGVPLRLCAVLRPNVGAQLDLKATDRRWTRGRRRLQKSTWRTAAFYERFQTFSTPRKQEKKKKPIRINKKIHIYNKYTVRNSSLQNISVVSTVYVCTKQVLFSISGVKLWLRWLIYTRYNETINPYTATDFTINCPSKTGEKYQYDKLLGPNRVVYASDVKTTVNPEPTELINNSNQVFSGKKKTRSSTQTFSATRHHS